MIKRRRMYFFLPLVILVIMAIYFNDAIPVYANPEQTVAVPEKSPEWAAFIYTTLIIGGIIISTLSYVSWRKYKGQRKRKQNSDKMVD